MRPISERIAAKDPEFREEVEAAAWMIGGIASCANAWGWDEQTFVTVARWAFRRESGEFCKQPGTETG